MQPECEAELIFNLLGPRPATALSLGNPVQWGVTVSNDPGVHLKISM